MYITFSTFKFYFICRTIIYYWSILFSQCQHAWNGSQYIYCCSFFSSIMIQQGYQQYSLSYLLYVDGSWECSHTAALGRQAHGIQNPSRHFSQDRGWVPLRLLMNPPTNTSTELDALQAGIQNNSANQHDRHTVCSTKFSRNGRLNNCAHMYSVNPNLFDLATQ